MNQKQLGFVMFRYLKGTKLDPFQKNIKLSDIVYLQ